MQRVLFANARVITPLRVYVGWLLTSGPRIEAVGEGEPPAIEDCSERIDCKGLYLSPGFIDIHTHGGGGHDFMDGSMEAVTGACRTHLAHGTTALLPTTLSSSDEELCDNLELISHVMRFHDRMPEILGAHLEGPYFSPEQGGAQDSAFLRVPRRLEYESILNRFPFIRIWSVAPELPGALEMGRCLRDHGIIASIGHSNAVYEEMVAAVENGYSMITHFFNGCSRLVRRDAKMYPGVVESGLMIDDLVAEIIADGCHLPPSVLRLIVHAKGRDGICLVTDSMRAAGQDVTESILGSLKAGQRVEIEGGVAYMPGRKSFGGSIATADRLVRTMVQLAGVPVETAVRMMSVTPARLLNVYDRIGSISIGKDADLLLFDEDIRIQYIMTKGKVFMDARHN